MTRLIDTRLDFLSPISLVPGLGPKRVAALLESRIATMGDLLYHFPRRYIDRSIIVPIAECAEHNDTIITVIGEITKSRIERGRRQRLRIQLTDESGSIEALWFAGIPYLKTLVSIGNRVVCNGKVSMAIGPQFVHPNIERLGAGQTLPDIKFLPVYPVSTAMKEAHIQQKVLCKTILWTLDNVKHYPQSLPKYIEDKHCFPALQTCLRQSHTPDDPVKIDHYHKRLVYEELYQLAVSIRFSKNNFRLPGRSLTSGDLTKKLICLLPFDLTEEQKKAVEVLQSDAASPHRMHRLLQGDVGSGKTIVALFATLGALNSGFQIAWLVPTEILAMQAHQAIAPLLAKLCISCEVVTGSTPKEKKRKIHADCAKGNISFIIGTHTLLGTNVTFSKLGMVVIDEQHRFGADQRLALSQKDPAADVLVMSATPIPQTLAKTLYGDLDIVSIRSLPKGRIPVKTHWVPQHKRLDMEQFVLDRIQSGPNQVFYVAPRIEADDTADDDNDFGLKDATSLFESLQRGMFSSVPMGLIHGKTVPEKTEETMSRFYKGDIKILVATTIIEVGIDVPNATILIIENADRFGLSQLHQLRGRVGRSSKQAYCFLLSNAQPASIAGKRLSYFCSHTNGFDIAEMDLTLRGPGEIAGIRQSGWEDLKMADILRDAHLFRDINEDIDELTSISRIKPDNRGNEN